MPIYVQHEVLGRIPDVFNAESIWQAPGLALFARRPLLRDLLERHPREHRGRAATRCFSHITLMLPQEDVDDDYHLTRGNRARELAQTLTALHQRDFGDLLKNDQVRYDVLGDDALAAGEIEVRFGHAVYLPAPDEKPLYTVSVSRDSAIWKPVCPIYPQQRLALIGGDQGSASYVAAGWPFGVEGAILLLNDGPDAPPVVQMRPKDAFDCRYDAHNGYYVIQSRLASDGAAPRLLLKVARTSVAPPSAKPAVWQNRPALATVSDEQTAVPLAPGHRPASSGGANADATYAPAPERVRQSVSLVALALPRLSRYRETGAAALEVPFGPELEVGAGRAISFVVNDGDELYACTAEGRQRITAPATFSPIDTRAIALLAVPPQMTERYCATLRLPQPVRAAVTAGARFTFGRGSPMLAALRVLDSPRFLQTGGRRDGDDGIAVGTAAGDGASADRIGLSRQAFSFEAAPHGFKIGRLAATQALYHLDEQLDFVASIGEAGPDQPYMLPAGHHLVAGHYVLRFDA